MDNPYSGKTYVSVPFVGEKEGRIFISLFARFVCFFLSFMNDSLPTAKDLLTVSSSAQKVWRNTSLAERMSVCEEFMKEFEKQRYPLLSLSIHHFSFCFDFLNEIL